MANQGGRHWPVIIFAGLIVVVGMSVWTIQQAIKNPVEMSDYGMQSYHTYDANINEIIDAKIAFDKQYDIVFMTDSIHENNTTLKYQLRTKEGVAINDATIEAVLTRPDTVRDDINLSHPSVSAGVYTFASVHLPKAGRWDVLTKIRIGKVQRYYNLKLDTRNTQRIEF